MVSVRILMTPQEYEELRRRRDVMRNAHVRSQEYVGGATMSFNHNHQHQQNNQNTSSSSNFGGLAWEHAAQMSQRRNVTSKLSPPIVRASGHYITGNPDEDPRMQLSRSKGAGTRMTIQQHHPNGLGGGDVPSSSPASAMRTAPMNYTQQNRMKNPSALQGYRYTSPRNAATGGPRNAANMMNNNNGSARNWTSAAVHGMSTDQLDKMRGFGAR